MNWAQVMARTSQLGDKLPRGAKTRDSLWTDTNAHVIQWCVCE
jgi:hypothetical protein